jgi:hypothetical protein
VLPPIDAHKHAPGVLSDSGSVVLIVIVAGIHSFLVGAHIPNDRPPRAVSPKCDAGVRRPLSLVTWNWQPPNAAWVASVGINFTTTTAILAPIGPFRTVIKTRQPRRTYPLLRR